jgi:hypothetical protein
LDRETFALVDSNTVDKAYLEQSVVQLDTRPNASAITSTNSISTPLSRVIAVVDRSANLKDAAMDIVRARFSFRGQSPYAPDLVLVNEFCIKEFCKLVAECALSFLAGDVNDASAAEKSSRRSRSESLQKDLTEESVTMVLSGTKATVAVVHQR